MNLTQAKSYYNTKPVEFVVKESYNDLKEDREFIPRFSLKSFKDFQNIPINEPIKYDEKILIKAIALFILFLYLCA